MLETIWIIPLLPLAGFLLNGLLGARFLSRRAVALLGCGVVLASFLLSVGAVAALGGLDAGGGPGPRGVEDRFGWLPAVSVDYSSARATQTLYTWMPLGRGADGRALEVAWSYALDPLSAVMLLVVTGVGFLIHV
ncbi:MAG: hypothetical protein ACE5JH_11080, partial [Acidobacteriota bacterium]